jgi:uncharacterized surface protein with fasciclin (FAS1) repeats
MSTRIRFLPILLLAALLLAPPVAMAKTFRHDTMLDVLANTKGAEALVATVLVVDDAGVLDFSLADLFANRQLDIVLFAPTNAAFEKLLGLEPGALNGLTIEQTKAALPGLLPAGVGPQELAAILAKHAAIVERTSRFTSSADALLREGSVSVADGSELAVGVGANGAEVNFESTIIRADFRARNGYIHFVDTVILDGLLGE